MLTDCSSFQGSTTSSSTLSDVMTLTTATTSSSWCAIGSGTRIRVLRLVRPHLRRLLVAPDLNPSYGFAVRGGKEFGTGFFVSSVERNSEADLKGLRVGDQILRINGFRVDDAVHKEFIQFVTSQDRVTLKVRGVGMLPIKDNIGERLSWHVVSAGCLSLSGGSSSSSGSSGSCSITPTSASATLQKSHHHHRSHQSLAGGDTAYKSSTTTTLDSRHSLAGHHGKDMTVVLNVAPRTKLGLGICKGPEWKPGIFVQFTKDQSVAREAGLRQGDQILSVNSIDFADVLFSEAVAVMKGSSKLEMLVRSGAGCDLFPGESSGYNSSASSVTGDQSPCWADPKSKRLTSVREEPPAEARAKEVNKTIIKLSENGTSINNTFIEEPRATKLPDVCFVGRGGGHGAEGAVKQVKIGPASGQRQAAKEQHYGILKMCPAPSPSSSSATGVNGLAAPPPKPPPPQLPSLDSGRGVAVAAPAAGCSLTSAIEEELRKRREKQQQHHQHQQHPSQSINDNGGGGIIGNRLANSQVSGKDRIGNSVTVAGPGSPTAAASSPPTRCNRSAPAHISDQHNALMDEFKRAHQRMFKNGFHENEQREQQDRQEALKRTTIMADEVNHRSSVVPPPAFNKISEKSSNGLLQSAHSHTASSIPPPPPQFANSPPKTNIAKVTNGTASPMTGSTVPATPRSRPPSSPVPDYDNVQLRNHGQASPGHSDSSYGTRRTLRLGTVTIGEYERPRKEPGKFDFIGSPPPPPQPQSQQPPQQQQHQQQQRMSGNSNNKASLHNELQHTLTRSNLRKTNMPQEHQSHCPNNVQHQQYSQRQSVSTLNRLTGNGKSPEKTANGSTNTAVRNGGILKNGGSSASSSSLYATASTKHSEKSISFGN